MIVPARMAATRLPGKPLADIDGVPMIVHVLVGRAPAGIGRVVVATDTPEIVAAVRAAGGEAVMTRADHPSGSDRIFEALDHARPRGTDRRRRQRAGRPADHRAGSDSRGARCRSPIPRSTSPPLAAEITDAAANAPIPTWSRWSARRSRPAVCARSISPARRAPSGDGPLYHHIGLYAYRRAALERFVTLPPSPLELRERLEQLRALEAGMRIDVALVDAVPLGVDTPADLEKARALLAAR